MKGKSMGFFSGVAFIIMELQTTLRQIIGISLQRIAERLLQAPEEPKKAEPPPEPKPKTKKPRKPYDPTQHYTIYFSSIHILRFMIEPENQDKKYKISDLEEPAHSTNRSTQRACEHLENIGILVREGRPRVYRIVNLSLATSTLREYEEILGDKGPPLGDETPREQDSSSDHLPPQSFLPRQGEGEGDRNPLVS